MIKNIFWNFIGNFFSVLINIGLIPIYIKYLGIEEYAIVSILGVLNSIFVILDLGLGISINREIARMSAINDSIKNFSNTVKTLQYINLFTGFIIFLILFLLSDFISKKWFVSNSIPIEMLTNSIKLIGLVLFFRWPISFYSNILIGFQKIPLLNYIKIIFFIIQGLFTYLLLVFYNFNLIDFFVFLVIYYFFYFVTMLVLVWKIKYLNFREGYFKKDVLYNLKKFIFGVSIISLLGVFFPIIDKFFVSKLFSLEIYSYYTIVMTIGFGVTQLVYPITSALFPSFTKLYFQKKIEASFFEFRFSFQLVGTLVISFLSIFFLYSQEILFVWTDSNVVYDRVKPIILPFIIGLFFYSFQIIPSLCVTAAGLTKKLTNNMIFVVVIYFVLLIISTFFEVLEFISYSWMISNIILFLINISLIKEIKFKSNYNTFIVQDVVYPTIASLVLIFFVNYFDFNLNIENPIFFLCEVFLLFFLFFAYILNFNFILKRRVFKSIRF
jgi:O-antigen/teichoic acid export membrane protein